MTRISTGDRNRKKRRHALRSLPPQAPVEVTRLDAAAAFILEELTKVLNRSDHESHMSRRIREACPASCLGLTNGDWVVATLFALRQAQENFSRDFISMTDDEEDEEEVA